MCAWEDKFARWNIHGCGDAVAEVQRLRQALDNHVGMICGLVEQHGGSLRLSEYALTNTPLNAVLNMEIDRESGDYVFTVSKQTDGL